MLAISEYRHELETYVEKNQSLLTLFASTSLFVSGAAGLIGSYLIDLLLVANQKLGLHIKICACDRNVGLLDERYSEGHSDVLTKLVVDICQSPLPEEHYDYVIHAASNTSPVDYATKPIDTIWTNIFGTKKLCELAVRCKARRFLFCSSVEAYGRNNGDVDAFKEDYSGYVDCNTIRANYPAAKRCSEALLNAYAAEYPDFEFVTARIGRFYGPTVIRSDSKAPSQFIKNAVNNESIVLKSAGTQLFSWGYVGDCATALLTILAKGGKGNAYNVADPGSCRMLKDFAGIAAQSGNGKLEFVEQTATEKAGYSKVDKATLDTSKLEALGWSAVHHLETGIPRTVKYLRETWR